MALGSRLRRAWQAFVQDDQPPDFAGLVARTVADAVTAEVSAKVEALEERLVVAEVGRPVGLPTEQLRRVGALTLAVDRSDAMEHHIMEQRAAYDNATKADLIETLLARDRQLLTEGKRLADGTVGSRILREFMRASLYAADGKADAKMVEATLQAMGAEPADARQLKLYGSTLGKLEP